MLELQCQLKCTSGFVAHLLVNRHGSDNMPVHQVTQQALCWSYRAEKLLQLILEPQPDIVCLQEVNRYGTTAIHTLQRHLHVLLVHGEAHFWLVYLSPQESVTCQVTASCQPWRSMAIQGPSSASHAHLLSSTVLHVMAVLFSTALTALTFVLSLKVILLTNASVLILLS